MRRWNPDWSHALLLAALTAALGWNWEQGRRLDRSEREIESIVAAVEQKRAGWTFGEPGESETCVELLDPHLDRFEPRLTRDAAFDLAASVLRRRGLSVPFERAEACDGELDRDLIRGFCEQDPFVAGMLFYDRALACGARR